MADFFSDTNINMMPSSNLFEFCWVHKMHAGEIQDSRFKYIYSSKLHDFNMDWYTGIGYE